jgi:glycosyltransferase 2 family protein
VTAPLSATSESLSTTAANTPTNPRLGRKRIYQLILGLGALLLATRRISAIELWDHLRQLSLFTLFILVLLNLLTTYLMAIRWQWLLKVKYQFSSYQLFGQYLIGQFFNLFAPGAVGGDAARVLMLGKQVNDRSFILATVVMERIVGLLGVLLSGFVSLYLANQQFHYPGSTALVAGLFLIVVALTYGLINYGERLLDQFLSVLARWKIPYLPHWSRSLLPTFFAALRHFRGHYGLLAGAMFGTILVRLCWTAIFWLLALSLDLPIAFFLLFTLLSIVDIARMLPLVPPNGLGVREYLFVILFGSVGVSASQALVLCLIGYNLLLINSLLGYPLYLWEQRIAPTNHLPGQNVPPREK